jgi:hypothetical protein
MSGKRFAFTALSGLVLGAVVGSLVPEHPEYYGYVDDAVAPTFGTDRRGRRHVNGWAGFGTAVGLLVGTAIGPVRAKPTTWSCADAAPSDTTR